jgi:hypothetical protein
VAKARRRSDGTTGKRPSARKIGGAGAPSSPSAASGTVAFATFPDLTLPAIFRAGVASGQQLPVETRPGRRPLILDPRVREAILQRIRVGAFEGVACEAAGVSQRTFMYWVSKGQQGIEPYVHFFNQVREARAQARLTAERGVHAQDRKFWLQYGPGRKDWRKEPLEVTTPDGQPIQVEGAVHLVLDDDQYREIARLAAVTGLLPQPESGDQGDPNAAPAE